VSPTDKQPPESAELRRLREEIDALDRRIVQLLNDRATLTVAVGHEKRRLGGGAIPATQREGERVSPG